MSSTTTANSSNPFNASPRKSVHLKSSPKMSRKLSLSPRRVFSPLLNSVSPSTTIKGDNNIRQTSKTPTSGDDKAMATAGSKSNPEKQNAKKSGHSQNTSSRAKQESTPNSSSLNGNGSFKLDSAEGLPSATSKQKLNRCSNQFCFLQKQREQGLSGAGQHSTNTRTAKSKITGELLAYCDICYSRFVDGHFCNICEQIYYDDINVDEKEWIQCDSCDLWTHLECEDEKAKKQLKNDTMENIKYDCMRCRIKESAGSQMAVAAQKAKKILKQMKQNATRKIPAREQQPVFEEPPKKSKAEKIQEKKRMKLEKSQGIFEEPKGPSRLSAIDQSNFRKASPVTHNLLSTNNYKQPSATNYSASSRELTTPKKCTPSATFDDNTHYKSAANDWMYTFETFIKTKIIINTSKAVPPPTYPSRPLQQSSHLTPFEEMSKFQGVSLLLTDQEIQTDFVKFQELSLDNNGSSLQVEMNNGQNLVK